MKQYINIRWEVIVPSSPRPSRPFHPWNIQRVYKSDDQFVIPANTLKFYRQCNCSQAQISHPEIDLRQGPVEFIATAKTRVFDSKSYNAKKQELIRLLVMYGAYMAGVDWNKIKLDREHFYSTMEEEVIVKMYPSIEEH